MKLDCDITKKIKEDFNKLWRCTPHGETLEISTPYRMPDSTLFTLYLTQRGDRIIACDGGRIAEILDERCELPEAEWTELGSIAREQGVKIGSNNGVPIYFKECRDPKLISSIAFDVAYFATHAAGVLVSMSSEAEEVERETRFTRQAKDFIKSVLRSDQTLLPNHAIDRGPDVRFSAVIRSGADLSIVACVGGVSVSQFRKNISDTADSFNEVWDSPLAKNGRIKSTIPLLNSKAGGYKLRRLGHRLQKLKQEARQEPVSWSEKYLLERQIRAA